MHTKSESSTKPLADTALIGSSGFVGTTLTRQAGFSDCYRSTTIGAIRGRRFDTAICAAAPAQKWIANRDPVSDLANINSLIESLSSIQCRRFVLISTVDVFSTTLGVHEESKVDESNLHPYGLHRRLLEKFVAERFENHLVVRLPGLVGPGLRKNVIFDFLNENGLETIDSRGIFQFYPMINLWYDIQTALSSGLALVHLTAEPVSVAQVVEQGFGRAFNNVLVGQPASYDVRTIHADLFGGSGNYQYSRRESLQAIRAYAQSEALTLTADKGRGR